MAAFGFLAEPSPATAPRIAMTVTMQIAMLTGSLQPPDTWAKSVWHEAKPITKDTSDKILGERYVMSATGSLR